MAYVSDLIGRPVLDVNGEIVGSLQDLVASIHGGMPHPVIVALAVKRSGGIFLAPFSDVAALIAPTISLSRRLQEIVRYLPGEHDLYLVRDVLDKQIIDTSGARVVRVSDLELARVNGQFYVANVYIGGWALLRRLGLARITQALLRRFRLGLPTGCVPWDQIELLPGDQPMRLKIPSSKISDLHPADLAEIISDLSRSESGKLLESLDVKTVADTLEEIEPEFQASLIETMPNEKAADVLEEMAPDEAADLLAELPQDRSQELLNLMERDEAEDVRKLLAYPEDTAGGLMTTEFVTVRPDLTAGETIAFLRENAQEIENLYYIYVTDAESHLLGVFSLKDLILARLETPVTEFMHSRVVTAKLTDSQDDVAQAISKYNLGAIPVVDDEKRLHGIVTADDALDKIIPTAWKKRLPRMYH